MPKALSSVPARLAIFVAAFAIMFNVTIQGEAAMQREDAAQGKNFLAVTKLTTGGPYQYTRNPMYASALVLNLATAVLADSLWMAAAMMGVPLYLNAFVTPAEEALLKKLFGKAFDEYAAVVPRWFF